MKNFLIFDCEANGLHGQVFAVAVVTMNERGEILDSFEGKCPIEGVLNSWVGENVIPHLAGMTEYPAPRTLRDAFWAFLQRHKDSGAEIWADTAWPVEAGFLSACVADDPGARLWEGPYPLLDVSTLLSVSITREEYVADLLVGRTARKHHPSWDAEVSGLALLRAKKLI